MSNQERHKGFNIPEGYFEGFEDRIELRLMEEFLPDTHSFILPDGYFDSLEDTLLKKTKAPEPKVISMFRSRIVYYVAGIAASLLLILNVSGLFGTGTALDEIPISTVESYIEETGMDYDSYDIMALMSEEEIGNLILDPEMFSEEILENYLLENLDNTSSLIIE